MIRMLIQNTNRWAPVAIAAAFMIAIGGCQFAPTKKAWPKNWFAKDDKPAVPDRMMIVWTDTILHQPQKPGVRGFGGRVFFYSGNETNPVTVDGALTIYAYDNDNVDSDSNRPERKYVFTEDQFAKHMSHTDLGPSYSIWLPWDEVGGDSRQLSLVSRFDGRSGGVVISKPAIKLLPGLAKKQKRGDAAVAKSVKAGVRQAGGGNDDSDDADTDATIALASHDEGGDGKRQSATRLDRPKPPRVSSMMIDLPPNFQRHLIDEPRSQSGPTSGRGAETPVSEQSVPQASNTRPANDSPVTTVSNSLPGSTTTTVTTGPVGTTGSVGRRNAVTNPRFSRSMAAFRNYANGSESLQEQPAQTLNRPAGWLEPIARPER
jgi:hypothetical protein